MVSRKPGPDWIRPDHGNGHRLDHRKKTKIKGKKKTKMSNPLHDNNKQTKVEN